MSDEILYSTDGRIGMLTINRPAARNDLNWVAQEQFAEVVRSVAEDFGLRTLIITGAGEQAFAAGGNASLFGETKASSGYKIERPEVNTDV